MKVRVLFLFLLMLFLSASSVYAGDGSEDSPIEIGKIGSSKTINGQFDDENRIFWYTFETTTDHELVFEVESPEVMASIVVYDVADDDSRTSYGLSSSTYDGYLKSTHTMKSDKVVIKISTTTFFSFGDDIYTFKVKITDKDGFPLTPILIILGVAIIASIIFIKKKKK